MIVLCNKEVARLNLNNCIERVSFANKLAVAGKISDYVVAYLPIVGGVVFDSLSRETRYELFLLKFFK